METAAWKWTRENTLSLLKGMAISVGGAALMAVVNFIANFVMAHTFALHGFDVTSIIQILLGTNLVNATYQLTRSDQ